jgi:hypothetical protein
MLAFAAETPFSGQVPYFATGGRSKSLLVLFFRKEQSWLFSDEKSPLPFFRGEGWMRGVRAERNVIVGTTPLTQPSPPGRRRERAFRIWS